MTCKSNAKSSPPPPRHPISSRNRRFGEKRRIGHGEETDGNGEKQQTGGKERQENVGEKTKGVGAKSEEKIKCMAEKTGEK